MSVYSELVDAFFLKYEKPVLDPLVVGFSGIDPPLKGGASELDHEELNGLLGGSTLDGHYHLTYEEWEAIRQILDNPEYDGGFASTTEEEYEANIEHWFDGGYSPPEQVGEVDGGKANI